MNFETVLFIALVVLTVFNNAIQVYIHFEAYPLFKYVGKAEFPAYVEQYEKRLAVPLMLPYGLTVLSNLALVFVRPEAINVVGVIVVLVLNLSVAAVTLTQVTAPYEEIKAAGTANIEAMPRLMRINLVRLVLSTLASVVVIYLLGTLL